MAMSHISASERAKLEQLSFWVREVFAERGYRIGLALGHDPSFTRGDDPRSTLARALMKSAVTVAAGHVGLAVVPGTGGARSVQSFDGNVDRRYRVRGAKVQGDGTFLIESNSDAILQTDDDSLYFQESWVLGYTLDLDNQVDLLFVAPVLDVIEGTPGYLELGPAQLLGASPTTPTGFTPSHEELEGFDDDGEGEGEGDLDAG